ncbi:CapA family protein [Paenibacillus sp. UMB4589-SE434]|uniref:CapA family protein n=1 Tax=Paenibacillus sp. UMB4589-SE434 TaxID=3046314 RepID=UPI00254EF737|nr:CapA family protein [Paenibacillus sp. UMB4589-SE434]MDK8182468.1 CapA family protein [Paenibacillus sp. UMB4589-SE434]
MRQSRSERKRHEKQQRQRRRGRLFAFNLGLAAAIVIVALYGWYSGQLVIPESHSTSPQFQHDQPSKQETGASSNYQLEHQQESQDKPGEDKSEETAPQNLAASEPIGDKGMTAIGGAGLKESHESISSTELTESTGSMEVKSPLSSLPDDQSGKRHPTSDVVRFTFIGDIINAGKVADVVAKSGYHYPYSYVKSIFQQDDLTIANVETPITKRGVPAQHKEFVYKSSPKMASAMKEAGIDVVNLANNHVMDQGEEGLIDTFAALQGADIRYVGAGKNGIEAYQPVIVKRNGMSIAVLGFSRVIPDVSWYAGKNKPGLAATYDPTKALESIRKAKQAADIVIVVAHWGKEKVDYPVKHQQDLAHAYIDAGADLIIGGHPHVLQGFEPYKGKWIAYSMGNFIFTRATQPKTWDTMVLEAECTKNGTCKLQMHPYYTELGRAVPLIGTKGQALISRMESISFQTRVDRYGHVTKR